MNPHHTAVDVTNAYEAHDRDAHTRSLGRLVAMVALGPDPQGMTLAQLEVRRQELHGQLARVNDRIARLERENTQRANAERRVAAEVQDARRTPLDPSE